MLLLVIQFNLLSFYGVEDMKAFSNISFVYLSNKHSFYTLLFHFIVNISYSAAASPSGNIHT